MTKQRHAELMEQLAGFRTWLDGLAVVGQPHRGSDLERLRALIDKNPEAAAEIFARLSGT